MTLSFYAVLGILCAAAILFASKTVYRLLLAIAEGLSAPVLFNVLFM